MIVAQHHVLCLEIVEWRRTRCFALTERIGPVIESLLDSGKLTDEERGAVDLKTTLPRAVSFLEDPAWRTDFGRGYDTRGDETNNAFWSGVRTGLELEMLVGRPFGETFTSLVQSGRLR